MKPFLLILCFALSPAAFAQMPAPEVIPLWENGAPDATGRKDSDKPTLTVYQPATGTATGTAVVICPGGGYGHLAMDHEGHAVAKWLNSLGITAFILKYRHAPAYRHPTPLRDAQRAFTPGAPSCRQVECGYWKGRYFGLFRRRAPGVYGRYAF